MYDIITVFFLSMQYYKYVVPNIKQWPRYYYRIIIII